MTKKLKVILIALILLIGILLPSINNYILRERLVTAQDYHSLDTIQVSLVSDGTHKEGLPETYLKTVNGFELADNTSTDGVVASKDAVIYQIKLTINAGRERDIYLKLSTEGDGLETDHLNAIGKLSGFLSTEPQGEDIVKIHVKRGLSGEFTTNLAVKAKDTAGETETDNRLVATLLDTNQNEIASSKSQPVTVISTVMADLTLDTGNALQETSYYQTDPSGSFVIRPYELQPNGYANYGISARATWHANLNVADFPDETEFFVHGENQKLTVKDNKIELTGTGIQIIDYKLPESSRPTNEAVMKTYAAHLENVKFDKSNYADPGDGKANDYNTFSAEISSMRGGTQPNNNYTVHRWLYKPPGNGIWDMSLVGPTDNGKTLFEEQNTHWTLEGDAAYLNSKWRRSITSGNDFAAKITISTKNANVVEQLKQKNQPLVFIDNPKATNDNPSHRYDSDKAAQVFVGDTPLNPNDYEITWQVNNQGEYSNSGNTPPENATSARVEIKQSALNNINENIRIYLPLKGLDYQDSDRGKATYHQTSSTIGNDESSTDSDSVYIVLPQPLTVTNNIDLITKDSDYEKRFVREVSVQGQIINPTISKGYTYTQTMTFHESYDLTTIDMGNTSWQIQSIDQANHTVTFSYTNATLTTFNEDNTSATAALPENNFTIKTIPYYNTGGNSITAPITVETKVTWDNDTEYLSGIDSQKNNEQQSDYALSARAIADTVFTFNQDVSSFAKAEAVEVNDPVTFTIYDSFGKLREGNTWYQKIILPSNNDNHWDYYNATVGSEQDRVSPNADGYSSVTDSQVISKYHGDYILSKITLKNAPKNTKVDLYEGVDQNKLAESLSLNEDGTVNIPNTIDLRKVKYIEVYDGPTDSNVQSTGAEINIEIQPTDNQAGDNYMIWPIGAKSSIANTETVPWAAGAKVVSSSISGTVFNDKNGNGIKESDEEVYKNITVELLDANGHLLNRSVKTDANGSYQFTELHSGNYQVKLPNVIRGEADTVSEVKDSNTSLKAKVKNRFGVDEQTVQTVAYNRYGQNATSQVSVNVPKESTIKNVDFGYHAPNHDASLDKSPATVSYKDGLATLRWDISITNTGDAPLTVGQLFDRTSKDVNIAKTQFSYGEKVISNQSIQGTIRKVIGFQMPETNGVLVFTDVGVWASTPSQNKRIVLKDASGEITPLPGNLNPDGFIGKGPFESSKGGGMAFWSGNELYMVKNDDSSTDSNLAGKIIAKKITFDQPIKSTDGLYPCSDGIIVITKGDNKVFQINSDGSTTKYDDSKWSGSTPTIVFGNTQFKILGTTNGAYLLDSTNSSTVTKLNGITGEIVAGSGNGGSEGWLIVNKTNQCWIATYSKNTASATSVNANNVLIKGMPIKTYGYRPNGDGQGAFLQTTQGVYTILSGKVAKAFNFNMSDVKVQSFGGGTMLVTGKEDNKNKFYILNIDGTQKAIAGLPETGDIKALAGDGGTSLTNSTTKGQFGVLIDNALYMINNDQVIKIYDSSNEELLGFGTRYLSVISTNSTNYSYIYTANEVYFIENKASGEVQKPATYPEVLKLQDGVNIDPSAEITEAGFIRRTFDVPTIAPGKTGVITLIGTMNVPKSADKIVGNQAWFTSPMTPRAGITTSAVKGTNMEDGVPDLPDLPTSSNFKPEAIYGTPTVSPNIAEDGSEYAKTSNTDDPIPDDLADATPAKIIHDTTVSDDYVSLAGVAWYDSDNDKKRGEGEERVKHIKVTLLDADNSPIQTTYTNDSGQWQFDSLQKGKSYSVVYQNNWQKDGHTYHPVARLTDVPTTYANDSDVNEFSVSDVITLPSTLGTGAIYSGVADMGLATYGEKITLTKGSKDSAPDTPEEIKLATNQPLPTQTPSINASKALSATEINSTTHEVDDEDNQLFTKAYPFKLTNSGNATLTNIQLVDTTNQGNAAVININLKKVDADGKEISSDVHLVGNSFKNESDSLITLDPGESITGYFQVALDQNHAIHQNTMQVTADVQDNPTIQVTDSDGFKLSYDYQDQTTIRLKKVDAYKNTALKNATFKLYATNATTVDNTSYTTIGKTGEALATLTTDENGEVSTQLSAGVYWLEESSTPTGYIPPNGHWIMQVSFNESGSREITLYADSSMPFAGVIGTNAYVTVKNYPFIQVPDTGGYRLWIVLAGATLLGISGMVIILNKKKRHHI